MDIKQIKELLSNPEVRQIIEEHVVEAVKEKQELLDTELSKLEEQKKTAEKELFIIKKTFAAKAELYESKLKEYYENKFNDAKKKLGKDTFDFINESIKTLSTTIEAELRTSTPAAKLQEAFSVAVRAMAPYMNINELADKNQSKIDDLTNKLNAAIKQNKVLESKALSADLHTLVVSECSGYPLDKTALLYETVLKMEPKSLTEGKEALIQAKEALKERELEQAALTEAKKAEDIHNEPTDKTKLKVIVEAIKSEKEKELVNVTETSSALDYDVYLG